MFQSKNSSSSEDKERLKNRILFKMTGSIACYKACFLISELVKAGFEVQVVTSKSALQFVGNATLEGLTGKFVHSELFESGQMMSHIHLMRWADLILVAPATAHFINRAAAGISEDLLTSLFLAHDFKKPYLIAPAMNGSMLHHPVTQESILKLQQMGLEILGTDNGNLACGETGDGRLMEPCKILDRIKELMAPGNNLNQQSNIRVLHKAQNSKPPPQKILITAGGTEVPIDSVRSITNFSTGQTGWELAAGFNNLGCAVTLLHSENSLKGPNGLNNLIKSEAGLTTESFRTYQDLYRLLKKELNSGNYSHIIHLAAVSDYRVGDISVDGAPLKVEELEKTKLPSNRSVSLRLEMTPKIVDELLEFSSNKNLQIIAFKLTTGATSPEAIEAVRKLFLHSPAHFVVHNDRQSIDRRKRQHVYGIFKRSKLAEDPAEITRGEGLDDLLRDLANIIIDSNSRSWQL